MPTALSGIAVAVAVVVAAVVVVVVLVAVVVLVVVGGVVLELSSPSSFCKYVSVRVLPGLQTV